MTFKILLWLKPGEDDDLIEILNSVEPRRRSALVRRMMRSGKTDVGIADEDALELLEDSLFDL